tara:strand:+ start:455 stop:853 length:399 start_codon:yes stop_codon:yes gene_type:complete
LSEIRATTISNAAGTGPITLTKQEGVKARCVYALNTPALTDSFNCSSLTDRATGRASVNLTSSMSNATYSLVAMNLYVTSGTAKYWSCACDDNSNTAQTTSAASVVTTYGDQNEEHFWDSPRVNVSIVGDLA